jgi:hypothetical protein
MDIFGFQKKINQTVDVIGNIFLERPPLLYSSTLDIHVLLLDQIIIVQLVYHDLCAIYESCYPLIVHAVLLGFFKHVKRKGHKY